MSARCGRPQLPTAWRGRIRHGCRQIPAAVPQNSARRRRPPRWPRDARLARAWNGKPVLHHREYSKARSHQRTGQDMIPAMMLRLPETNRMLGAGCRRSSAGFAEQERPRVGIRGVLMPGESPFQPFPKHRAEFCGQRGEEPGRVYGVQDGARHQSIEARAEPARVQMLSPEGHLFGRHRRGQGKRAQCSSASLPAA